MSTERLHLPEPLIGQTSEEVVRWLAESHPEIERFDFVIYRPREPNPPALEDKITTGPDDTPVELGREEILSGKLRHLIEGLKPDLALGINSNVIFQDGRKGQIPMMDFECEIGEENAGRIKRLIKLIGFSGLLLISGASYHFIGKEVIKGHRRWERFLGKCLLSGLADPRYIGHAFDIGFSTLRVSITESHPSEPEVVEFIL